jgi:hypothetical protein
MKSNQISRGVSKAHFSQFRQRIARTPAVAASILTVLVGCTTLAKANTVGYWRFEEGTPGNTVTGANSVLDSSGNGLNLSGNSVYSSDVAPQAAAIGSAVSMHFNGSSQQLTMADNTKLQLTHSLTIEAFIKAEPLVAGTGMQGQILFRGDNRPGLDPYELYVSSSGQIVFQVDSATSIVSLAQAIPNDQWLYVAGTLDDATGQMKLYVNGNVVASTTTTVRPLGPLDANFKPGLGVGSDQDSQYAELFNGWIDEVRLSDVALQPGQLLVPEPSCLALAGLGAVTLLAFRNRKAGPNSRRA